MRCCWSFTRCAFLSSAENKTLYFEECWVSQVQLHDFNCISSVMFLKINKSIQFWIWNDTACKWPVVMFWVNYPSNSVELLYRGAWQRWSQWIVKRTSPFAKKKEQRRNTYVFVLRWTMPLNSPMSISWAARIQHLHFHTGLCVFR